MVTTSKVDQMMRKLMKTVVTGQPLGDYSNIENARSIDEIKKGCGKPQKIENARAF